VRAATAAQLATTTDDPRAIAFWRNSMLANSFVVVISPVRQDQAASPTRLRQARKQAETAAREETQRRAVVAAE
jgi:hypothetical protein